MTLDVFAQGPTFQVMEQASTRERERPDASEAGVLPDWPLFGWADDIRPMLRRAAADRIPAALVTLVDVDGGGPRSPGAQMLFCESEAGGYLSGGCVEADVAIHARETLRDGAPRRLVYGRNGPWADIQLPCGSQISLLVERLSPGEAAVTQLLALTDQRQPALWRTDGARRRAVIAAPDGAACAFDAAPATDLKTRWVAREKPVSMTNSKALLA